MARELNFLIQKTGLKLSDLDTGKLLAAKNLRIDKDCWSVPRAYTFPWEEPGQVLRGKHVTLLWKEGNGEGLEIPEDAIKLYTIEDIQSIGQDENHPLDAYYLLMNDIDAIATRDWNDGLGFVPIGGPSNQFEGTFNGCGHTIHNLWIERGDEFNGNNGLFSWINATGKVHDLFLQDCSVLGGSYNAGLQRWEGGLHTACLVACNSGLIERCAVIGGSTRGYLCGLVVGWNDGNVFDCRALGTVYGTEPLLIGGFVGQTTGIIRRCYSAAEIIPGSGSEEYYGGFCGLFGVFGQGGVVPIGEISYCYYDSDVSKCDDEGKGIPYTTEEMQQADSYVGFDFVDTWDIEEGEGYPFLVSRFAFEPGLEGFYAVDESDLSIVGIKNVGRLGHWQMADFGQYIILTDGTSTLLYSTEITPKPRRIGAVCARDARLVYGDVDGEDNIVGWSSLFGEDIPGILEGTTESIIASSMNESGFTRMPWRGKVKAIKCLGDTFVVYGEDGISGLKESGGKLAFVDIAVPNGLGIYDRGAVDGDNQQHVFRGSDGAIWSIDENLRAVKLDYEWTLTDQNLVVFDDKEGIFWIVGTTVYALTKYGLAGPIDQAPTSLIPHLGVATGTPYGDDIEVELRTNTLDVSQVDQKRITFVKVNGTFEDGKVGAFFKYTSSDSLREKPLVRCSPEGAAFVNICFVYGQVRFVAAMSPMDTITRVEVRYQVTDRRFTRGTRAVVSADDGD